MRALLPLLIVLSAALGAGNARLDAAQTDLTTCESDADMLWDDPRWEADDWSPLLPDAHRLVLTHAGVNGCTARLRHIENLILEYTGRFVALDSAQAHYFDDGFLDVSPVFLRTKELRMRGRNDLRLGRVGDAAAYFFRAAIYADSLPEVQAAKVYLEAAKSARIVGRPEMRDGYLARAEAALSDSLRRSDSDDGRFALSLWSAVLSEDSQVYLDSAAASADPAGRERLLRRALEINDQALDAIRSADRDLDGGERAALLQARASIARRLGDEATARASARSARTFLGTEEGVTPGAYVEQTTLEGDIEADFGRTEDARDLYREAQELAVSTGVAAAFEVTPVVALGELEERGGRLALAERAYRTAVSLQEVTRERTGLREWTASAFAQQQAAHRGLARVLLRQGDVRGSLAALDATRARAYHDLRRFRERHRALSGDRRRRVDALIDSVEAARRQVARPGGDMPRVQSDLVAYQDSMSEALGVEPIAAAPLDVPAVQSWLENRNRDVVAYSLDAHASTAYVVTADTVAAVSLPAGQDRITGAAARMLAPWRRATPDPAADLNAAYDLYRAVIKPVESFLTPGRPLTIVPDGILAHVPFGMLPRGPAESYRKAEYLVHRHALTMELAVGLVPGDGAPSGRGDVVAFGRSKFEEGVSESRGTSLGALPHVVSEVRQVSRHATRSVVALDDRATESSLERLAPTASVLHIATHAISDAELPMNSRVVLTPDANSGEDGQLHLYELQNRDLAADLVVLSGCATAAGELQIGEGLTGMSYGVRVAGAAASIATLWSVDDRATVFLMDALYAGLADGLGKDEALRQAQLAYLDAHDGLEASPFFWAAPILSGAPVPIPLGAPSKWWVWALGLSLAVALAWRFTRRIA